MERFEDLGEPRIGGMARVRRVRDRGSGEIVALKTSSAPEHDDRIRQEFGLLSRLRHSVLPVGIDLGVEPGGRAAFTQTWVEGGAPAPLGPTGAAELAKILGAILHALAYLHRNSLVYLDLKPDNLLYLPGSPPRLVDLGLAREIGDRGDGIAGTIPYFAPELLRSETIDQRADLYSVGLLLVHLWSGGLPFRSPGGNALAQEKIEEGDAIVERARKRVGGAWGDWAASLLAPDPAERCECAEQAIDSMPISADPPRGGDREFTGRESILDAIACALESARREGSGRIFVLRAAEGGGVSRLLIEAVRRAQLQGLPAARVAAKGSGFAARLRSALGSFTTGRSPFETDPLDAVLASVDRVGREDRPTLLALETRGKPDAMVVARQCAAAAFDLPLILLSDHPTGADNERVIELPPLDRREVMILATRVWGREAAERFSVKLHRSTGGNPRFLSAVMESGPPGSARIPDSVVDLLLERVATLPGTTRSVLNLLALLQLPVSRNVVAMARDLSEDESRKELESLARIGVVTQRSGSDTGSPLFAIALADLGKRLSAGMTQSERETLHGAIGGALRGYVTPQEILERSRHGEMAGDSTRAHSDSLLAARRPDASTEERIEALERAIRSAPDPNRLERIREELAECLGRLGRVDDALKMIADAPEDPGPRRLRIRGELLARCGRFDEAEVDLESVRLEASSSCTGSRAEVARASLRLARIQEGRGDAAGALRRAEAALEAAARSSPEERESRNVLGSLLLAQGRGEEAERELRRVLESSRAEGDRKEEAAALNNLGIAAMTRSEWSRARERFERGLKLQDDLGDLAKQATAWDNLGIAAHRAGDGEVSVAALEQSLRYRMRIGDPKRIADSHNNLGALYYTKGEHATAARHLERALVLRRRLAIPADISKTLNNLALLHSARGKLDDAIACLEQSIEIKNDLDDAEGVANSRVNLASIVLRAGDPGRAHRLLDEASAHASDASNESLRLSVLEHRAAAHLASGDPELALSTAMTAVDLQGGEGPRTIHALLAAIDARLALGEGAEGCRLADQVLELSRDGGVAPSLNAPIHRRLAQVHIAAGDLPKAMVHHGEAWTSLRRGVGDPEEGECLRMEGELLAARGRPAEARERFERAIEHHARWGGRLAQSLAYAALGDAAECCGDASDAERARRLAREGFDDMGNRLRQSGSEAAKPSRTDPDPLQILRRVGSMLTGLGDPDEVLEGALSIVLETIGAERGQIFLVEPNDGGLEIRVARNMDAETSEDAAHHSRTILERTLAEQTVLFSDDAQSDEDFKHFQSVARYRIVSFICVPMVTRGRAIGTIYVDNRSVVNRFDRSDAVFMQVFASLAAVAVENAALTQRLVEENRELKREAREEWELPSVVGRSPAMQRVAEVVRKVAKTRSTVLLLGETGTGKEVLARAIHYESDRADKRFVAVDCGALQPTIIESELFGHRRGAFSGAVSNKAGLFEEADGGTIFLDEITNMEPGLQTKLLRVLQESEVRRLGDTRPRRVDVRVVCATNTNLRSEVDEGRFREDLFFRINIVPISLPPLRERRSDIVPLTAHFLEKMKERIGRGVDSISPEVRDALLAHDWPGNVRELQNTLEGMVVMCRGDALSARDLPPWLVETKAEPSKTLSGTERQILIAALEQAEWIQTRAARKLGISERVLRYKMKKHGIENPRRR